MDPNTPIQLNENAPLQNPFGVVQGFQGWLTQLQNYAKENPGLVAIFGVGLLILAFQGMVQQEQPKGKGKGRE